MHNVDHNFVNETHFYELFCDKIKTFEVQMELLYPLLCVQKKNKKSISLFCIAKKS